MNVIETEYNSYRFRSRLEARWAVFMDVLGVRYVYEPEAYNLGKVCYLPDFYLPNQDCFLEIKPSAPSGDEEEKCCLLCKYTGKEAFILQGNPTKPDMCDGRFWYGEESYATLYCRIDEEIAGCDYHYVWCECPHCHRCELQFDGRADRIKCKCPKSEHGDRGHNVDSTRLRLAYNLARRYRFEPGAIN